ncbi:DUF6167 family protein [Nocardioides solisilvae]|uniref:DUF6167 family protein n=1 Tax=Nocardioides solisilvae TaxID=1542435 RepID=UPI000D7472BF|nr:DUF6167 family protein [Nocardioides solisilvae]
MSRGLWFVAGAGAGAYAANRARRALASVSAEGLRHRWQGLAHAARLAGEEMHAARAEKETELRHRLGLDLTGPAALPAGSPPGGTPAPLPAQQTPHPTPAPAPRPRADDDTRDRT